MFHSLGDIEPSPPFHRLYVSSHEVTLAHGKKFHSKFTPAGNENSVSDDLNLFVVNSLRQRTEANMQSAREESARKCLF